MNWIMSLLFIVVMFTIYYFIGDIITDSLKFEKKNKVINTVVGFIALFFLTFLVGVPFQNFQFSWISYVVTMSVVFLLVLGGIIYIKRNYFKDRLYHIKMNWKSLLVSNFKNYWYVYLLACIFLIFSISNEMAFYRMNYDDPYYIGKVVNTIGTPKMLNENFFNGSLVSNLDGEAVRLLNTYEITCSYFSSIFHIAPPFFCRVAMVLHNYLIIFITYSLFASKFMRKELAQFALFIMSFLLVAAGAWHVLDIKIYDLWQFQTAIFYGSSIVRSMAIPCIILLGFDLIKRFNIRQFLFLIVTYVTFFSFSSIFLQFSILLTYALIVVKVVKKIVETKDKKRIMYILVLFAMGLLLLATKKLDSLSFVKTDSYVIELINYKDSYYDEYLVKSVIFGYGYIILILSALFLKGWRAKSSVLIIAVLFIILRFDYFSELVSVSGMNYFFVTLRTVTAITMMLLLFVGIMIIKLIERIKYSSIYAGGISVLCLLCTLVAIRLNMNTIVSNDFLASGIDKDGYNFTRIFTTKNMVPLVAEEVGEYFDQLEYGNYSLLVPKFYEYGGIQLDTTTFNIVSNRIEICQREGCNYMPSETYDVVTKYFDDKLSIDELEEIVNEFEIEYILVYKDSQKETLLKQGYESVLITTDGFSLFKIL